MMMKQKLILLIKFKVTLYKLNDNELDNFELAIYAVYNLEQFTFLKFK